MYKRLWAWSLLLTLLVGACGRYFHTPLQPASRQAEGMTVNDDGSITYALDRLSINLKPMTDEELTASPPGQTCPTTPIPLASGLPRATSGRRRGLPSLDSKSTTINIQGQDRSAQRPHCRGQHPAVRGAELRSIISVFSVVLAGPHGARAQDLSSPHGRAQADAVQRGLGLQRQRRTGVFSLPRPRRRCPGDPSTHRKHRLALRLCRRPGRGT